MPDEGDGAPGRTREVDVGQHLAVGVGEAHALEGDVAAQRRQRSRVGVLLHLDGRVEELVDALPAGDGALREAGEPADDLGRVHEHHQVGVEGDEGAERQVALDDLTPPVPEQEGDGQVGDEGDEGDVDGPRARRVDARLEDARAARAELGELVVLAGEDAHDARPDHVLLGRRGHVGEALLDVLEDRLQALAETPGHDQQGGQEGEREQGQPPVHHQQDHGHGDHHDEVDGEEDEPVAEEHAHVLHVAHRPRHELPGRPAVVVGEGLPQEVGPEAVAQVVLDAEARLAADVASRDADDEAHDADAEQAEPVPDEQAALAAEQGAVDGELGDARHDETQPHLGEGEHEAGDSQQLVVAEEPGDAPEGPHRSSLPGVAALAPPRQQGAARRQRAARGRRLRVEEAARPRGERRKVVVPCCTCTARINTYREPRLTKKVDTVHGSSPADRRMGPDQSQPSDPGLPPASV